MDALTDVLTHIRSSGALMGQTLADPPWSVTFAEQASLSLVAMLRGEAWIASEDDLHPLKPHDIAVVVGPAPFTVTSDPQANPIPLHIQSEAGHCLNAAGNPTEAIALGTRTCGTHLDAEDAMLTGSFTVSGRVADRLLDALPRVLVVPRTAHRSPTLQLMEAEILREEPGQQAILDRLLDLLLAGALRDWFTLPGSKPPSWYRATSDPIVGPALAAIHENPEHPWTIELLAREAHVSRATLARRFSDLLGEPPMTYLTSWRMCMAADLLESHGVTVESVARDVGYSSAYALSTAFHREYGIRPTQHRHAPTRRL